jgi:hypothetical protein
MVELEMDDYNEILDWFTLAFGRKKPKDVPVTSKKTFYKLTFLAEDKMKEIAQDKED